jgi:hypothetical protein
MRIASALLLLPAVVAPGRAQLGGPTNVVSISAATMRALPVLPIGNPTLRIGENPADDASLMNRAGLPIRLNDGRVAVPMEQREIRYYSAGGKFLMKAGQRGQGPGDFRQLWSLHLMPGDSILAFDAFSTSDMMSRFSVFSPSGLYVRMYNRVAGTDLAMLPDAALVRIGSSQARHLAAINSNFVGVLYDTAFVLRTVPGNRTDTLMRIPAQPSRYGEGQRWGLELNFVGSPHLAGGEGGIVVAHGSSFDLYWFDANGKPLRRVRVDEPAPAVTEALKSRQKAIRQKMLDAARARGMRGEGGAAPPEPMYASHAPVISRLRMDRTGRLWVRRWVMEDETEAEWVVFSKAGQPVGRVRFPATFTFQDAGADWVLGRYADPDGVQSVRMYRVGMP